MKKIEGATSWKQGVAWIPELETGNEEIDSQHKQLFRLTSNLIEACVSGQSAETLGKTLGFLVDYTVEHFRDEEALQLKHNYPDYEKHKKLHDNFKATVGELVAQYKADGSSDKLADVVNTIVVRWLTQHITMEDFKIAAHIRREHKKG
ncbi:hemerythrin [Synergistales bacterium]|nr:hemerythrin [Synergistales bacterium]